MATTVLANSEFPALKCVPVTLSPVSPRYSNRIWSAEARADEDIVAVLFESQGAAVQWCKTPASAHILLAEVLWGEYPDPREIQVAAALGGAMLRHSVGVTTRGPPTFMLGDAEHRTGRLGLLGRVDAEPTTEFWAFFIARSDVKFGRNRLWHLRRELALGLAEPFEKLLSYGRCGDFIAH